jgi:cytochrome c oxidase cbb3-type subunit 4
MTYEAVSQFAQQWGAVYFVAMFLVGVGYAAWPRKRDEFHRAARLPLDEEA